MRFKQIILHRPLANNGKGTEKDGNNASCYSDRHIYFSAQS